MEEILIALQSFSGCVFFLGMGNKFPGLLLPQAPRNCFCSQHRFSRGFIEVMGQVWVLDAKQIERLQPETERDMTEGRFWQDNVYRKSN